MSASKLKDDQVGFSRIGQHEAGFKSPCEKTGYENALPCLPEVNGEMDVEDLLSFQKLHMPLDIFFRIFAGPHRPQCHSPLKTVELGGKDGMPRQSLSCRLLDPDLSWKDQPGVFPANKRIEPWMDPDR